MEHEAFIIKYKPNRNIFIRAYPGHFATNHSHINYYIDVTDVKHNHVMARTAAREMATQYAISTMVDTIICMDGAEIIGGFLARALAKSDIMSINSNAEICVIRPEYNTSGQMIFRDNLVPMIRGKHILLLIASVTTGKTIIRSLECIKYYGGVLTGISAVFSAVPEAAEKPIHHLFGREDIPDYHTYPFDSCPLCENKVKIDAIVNSYGYSAL